MLVVGDDPLARRGMAAAFADREDIALAGQLAAADTELLDGALARGTADVVVWDASASAPDGLDALDGAPVPVVALVDGPETAEGVLAGGPMSLVARDGDSARMAAAVHAARAGLLVLEPELVAPWMGAGAPSPRPPPPSAELTPREHEVLERLAEGQGNRAIAEALGISVNTVKYYVNALLAKLDAHSRTEAVVKAARLELLDL